MNPKPYPNDKEYLIYPDGRVGSTKSNKFLSQYLTHRGYFRVSLSNHKKHHVHRLVAETFIQNDDPAKIFVNHKDENKTNNHVDNLEGITPKDNSNYGTRNQRASVKAKYNYEKIGRNNPNKPNVKPVSMCDPNTHEVLQNFPSAAEAARYLGHYNKNAHQNISNCVNGRSKTAYGYYGKFSDISIDFPTLEQ